MIYSRTQAADFITAIQNKQIKDIPYFREYIPVADKEVAKEETERKCHALQSAETIAMIECVEIGETVEVVDIIRRSGMQRGMVWDRIRRSKRFEKVRRGFYRRIK